MELIVIENKQTEQTKIYTYKEVKAMLKRDLRHRHYPKERLSYYGEEINQTKDMSDILELIQYKAPWGHLFSTDLRTFYKIKPAKGKK